MSLLWPYFWPAFAAGLLAGLIAGMVGFRRRSRRNAALAAGLAAALAAAVLWHGPLGAADRLSAQVERIARTTLDYYEMSHISARLHRGPLTRRLILRGRADEFQTQELVRVMSQIPGVSRAQWDPREAGPPLLAEVLGVGLLGFLLGLLLAYLIELRRRHNAQWNW